MTRSAAERLQSYAPRGPEPWSGFSRGNHTVSRVGVRRRRRPGRGLVAIPVRRHSDGLGELEGQARRSRELVERLGEAHRVLSDWDRRRCRRNPARPCAGGRAFVIYPTTGTTGARYTLLAARSAFEGSNGRSAGSREDEPLPTPALPQSLSAELGCSRFASRAKEKSGSSPQPGGFEDDVLIESREARAYGPWGSSR